MVLTGASFIKVGSMFKLLDDARNCGLTPELLFEEPAKTYTIMNDLTIFNDKRVTLSSSRSEHLVSGGTRSCTDRLCTCTCTEAILMSEGAQLRYRNYRLCANRHQMSRKGSC
jgi:hypothetical protein